jgi:hypothetical protein
MIHPSCFTEQLEVQNVLSQSCIHFVITECSSIGIGAMSNQGLKFESYLFVALKVISLTYGFLGLVCTGDDCA